MIKFIYNFIYFLFGTIITLLISNENDKVNRETPNDIVIICDKDIKTKDVNKPDLKSCCRKMKYFEIFSFFLSP